MRITVTRSSCLAVEVLSSGMCAVEMARTATNGISARLGKRFHDRLACRPPKFEPIDYRPRRFADSLADQLGDYYAVVSAALERRMESGSKGCRAAQLVGLGARARLVAHAPRVQ